MIGPLRQRWSLPPRQKRAGPARQFRPRRDAVARPEPGDAFADLDDPGAEFVAEKLDGGLGLQPPLDGLVGERRDAEGELGLGDARLDAERFGDHMAPAADRLGHVVQPHVAEPVETPGFHDRGPPRDATGRSSGSERRA